ncbi:translocation/assembly module TamB domain-containing protein [Rhodobacteraceae bacterium D3-12]|nr:translocation/assembly module TamB domain-containing protein [Rhodobacteraceae bacterium D3-12]
MRRFTVLLFATALLCWPVLASAQTQDDRGYLQSILEDSLSDAGRQVRIIGFEGALSSQAKIQELTIADDKGIWLTMRGVELVWTRSALLKGHLSVDKLSADEILLPRGPVAGGGDVPAPEASGFALPDLPVTVTIGQITSPRIVLGAPVIGRETVVSLDGSAKLDGGAGEAKLEIIKVERPADRLGLAVSYSNTSTVLDLALNVSEGAGGIVAHLIDLPGQPSIAMSVEGTGPLDAFKATLGLSTDDQPRLAGSVTLTGVPASEDGSVQAQRKFVADLGGDIAPVFLPQYRGFFGPDIRLAMSGAAFEDGRVQLDDLTLNTRALNLAGMLHLSADGWPVKFDLNGTLSDATSGEPVLLPISGVQTRVQRAGFTLGFDAEKGDTWVLDADIEALNRADIAIEAMRLAGSGTIFQGEGTAIGSVRGAASYSARGLVPADAALARALGSALNGELAFGWAEDAPLRLTSFALNGADYGLSGNAAFKGLMDGLNIDISGAAKLKADDMARFADLAGVAMTGAAEVTLSGQSKPLAGSFTLGVDGTGRDLGIGQAQVDPLFQGASQLALRMARDETGTRIEKFTITSDHASARLSGALATGASQLTLSAQIAQTARVMPGLNGASTLSGTAKQSSASDWVVDMRATGPGKASAGVKASVAIDDDAGLGRITGTVQAEVASLAPYATPVGRPVSGGVTLEATGWVDPLKGTFEATFDGTGRSLGAGIDTIDQLLRGTSTLSGTVRRAAGEVLHAERIDLTTPQGRIEVNGTASGAAPSLRFDASLRDIGLLAPGVNGPATAQGTAELVGQSWRIAVQGRGPGGTEARVSGQISAATLQADLEIAGRAPLGFANRFIAPNVVLGTAAYDLSLNGPLALSSLSGRVTVQKARLAVPEQNISLAPINATVTLAGAKADVTASAQVAGGGQITVTGPVGLNAPYTANLEAVLNGVAIREAELFRTSVDGRVSLRGPLTSGAAIRAALSLGTTEVQVPESGGQIAPVLDGLRHVNEPGAVRRTRARAGLLDTGGGSGSSGGGAVYPIDIVVDAPARVFIRGRGLDAELGGQLRLTGTTANVITQGRFDLIRGRLDVLTKRLTLSEGYVQLRGSFDPFIYLVATAQSADTDISIIMSGLASDPEISFTSSPDLPEDEILSRLLFGRGLSKISALQAVQLAAAVQTLAGGGSGLLDKLRENLGVDDLDITTSEDGTTGAKVGKYLSDKVYTDVTVGSDGSSEINLNIQISPSVTGRGSVNSEGESSLGVFFERDY